MVRFMGVDIQALQSILKIGKAVDFRTGCRSCGTLRLGCKESEGGNLPIFADMLFLALLSQIQPCHPSC
eukprot:1139538-Pelagomonas_calceolata.AAC.6